MSFLRMNNRQNRTAFQTMLAEKHHDSRKHPPLDNVVTYLVKRYASNGKIHFPKTAGGIAFAKAMERKGIIVRVGADARR